MLVSEAPEEIDAALLVASSIPEVIADVAFDWLPGGHSHLDTSELQHSKSSLHSSDPLSSVLPQHDFSPLLTRRQDGRPGQLIHTE